MGFDAGFDVEVLTRGTPRPTASCLISLADDPAVLRAAGRLRHEVFVVEQQVFGHSDRDDVDDDPRALTLVARDPEGGVLGTVRLGPRTPADLGWWAGSRLAVRPEARGDTLGIGSALVQAACAYAEGLGALRFDALVQPQNASLFRRLGWRELGPASAYGRPHLSMTWPLDRIERLAVTTKARLGRTLAPFLAGHPAGLGGPGFVGDDGAPVPGSDLIAATDAIIPSMVERDPEWAGWCSVLVNVNDLAAMGAAPVALLDAIGARDASFATRIVHGITAASRAWDVPVIGGHTQLGVPAALSVTALGRTAAPVRAGGGRPGHTVSVTVDTTGGWRRGYTGTQWDSSSSRTPAELQRLGTVVARTAPAAAKDISMAGLVGTLGMLAEASGCGAVLDVAAVPKPVAASMGDWLSCFPGFGMITTDRPGAEVAAPAPAVSTPCGELRTEPGVQLRWPDGLLTTALPHPVTGLGLA